MLIKEFLKDQKLLLRLLRKIRRHQLQKAVPSMRKNGYVVEFKGVKSKFYLPKFNSDNIQSRIFIHKDYYERRNLDYVCKKWKDGMVGMAIKGRTVLDIGANIGNHTLYYLNECNAQLVYSFEPVDDVFQFLKKNIEVNHLSDKVHLVNAAVGSEKGKATVMNSNPHDSGITQVSMAEDGIISVLSIDEMGIESNIGLVKIDVEGFEIEALRGMLKILRRDLPFIMIEIWDSNLEKATSMLTDIGYQYVVLSKNKKWPNGDYLFFI